MASKVIQCVVRIYLKEFTVTLVRYVLNQQIIKIQESRG